MRNQKLVLPVPDMCRRYILDLHIAEKWQESETGAVFLIFVYVGFVPRFAVGQIQLRQTLKSHVSLSSGLFLAFRFKFFRLSLGLGSPLLFLDCLSRKIPVAEHAVPISLFILVNTHCVIPPFTVRITQQGINFFL